MKVVISSCYGGFSVSTAALEILANKGYGPAVEEIGNLAKGVYRPSGRGSHLRDIERDNPLLIELVEGSLGVWTSGDCAKLKVVEVDPNSNWYVHEYDGYESIKTYGDEGRGVNLMVKP